jgi:paraquat-inducible protein B
MGKPVNKTLIGVFVLGAVALVVVGLLVFGSGKFFTKTNKYVLFFKGSVKGLNLGSPVMFRGVKIGEVKAIQLRFNPKELSAVIPVYVEIDPSNFRIPDDMLPDITMPKLGEYQYVKPLIMKGLKAQLQMQSFVTGQLMINLDFYPERSINLVGLENKYPEIPTVPSSLEQLTDTLEQLNIDEFYRKLIKVVDGVDKFLSSGELKGSLQSMNQTLKDTDTLVKNLDARIEPLVADIQNTSEAARKAMVQADKALSEVKGIPVDVKETMQSARSALGQAEKTFLSIRNFTEDTRNLSYELNRSLQELSAAARSIRGLADYLERHPEALIRGKKNPKGD